MKFVGEFVDIMCEVNPEYAAMVAIEHGKKVICMKIKKAIYGMVESALLWSELFSTTLQNIGFTINPYDKFLSNRMVNGKQCTMAWYVNEIKISQQEDKVCTQIADIIESRFGKGKKHTFLAWILNY